MMAEHFWLIPYWVSVGDLPYIWSCAIGMELFLNNWIQFFASFSNPGPSGWVASRTTIHRMCGMSKGCRRDLYLHSLYVASLPTPILGPKFIDIWICGWIKRIRGGQAAWKFSKRLTTDHFRLLLPGILTGQNNFRSLEPWMKYVFSNWPGISSIFFNPHKKHSLSPVDKWFFY